MIDIQNIKTSNTWIIRTGDASRNYFKHFKNFGVVLIGPGHPGKEGESETEAFYKKNNNVENLGKILKQVKIGEYILAVKKNNILLGVRRVTAEYDYSNLFNDVDGWCRNYFIRVDWYIPDNQEGFFKCDENYFPTRKEICRVKKTGIFKYIQENQHRLKKYQPDYNLDKALSKLSKEISFEALSTRLSGLSVDNESKISIVENLERLKKEAIWYFDNDYDLSESEICAFLVIPFFKTLGWNTKQIKLELQHTDISLFEKEFNISDRKSATCPNIIVEVKTYKDGLAFTQEQVKGYGEKFKKTKKFVVTNGYRYIYFEKKGVDFIEKGSFNLRKLREKNDLIQNSNYLDTTTTILEMSDFSS